MHGSGRADHRDPFAEAVLSGFSRPLHIQVGSAEWYSVFSAGSPPWMRKLLHPVRLEAVVRLAFGIDVEGALAGNFAVEG